MTKDTTTKPRQPRRWLRWIGYGTGGLIVLLVVAYFVGTSAWCVKSVVLPKVGAALNAKVTLEDADISPFSAVTLRGLKVHTTGTAPLVSVNEVRLRYSLMDIIGGRINVSEVTLQSPIITLVTAADGTSNLDPVTKQPREKQAAEKKPGQSAPPQIDLKKFALNNATITLIKHNADGSRQFTELSGVNITAADLANGRTARLALAADARVSQEGGASAGVLATRIAGVFDVSLDSSLQPGSARGDIKVNITQAQGTFARAANFAAVLNVDASPAQVNDVSLRVNRAGSTLAALSVNGPFDARKMEGRLTVALAQIDRELLGLVGDALGINFNQTTIGSTNVIELTQGGRMVSVNGQCLVNDLSLTRQGLTTPALRIAAAYALTYDQTNKTALVRTFSLAGTKLDTEFLRGTLARPMLIETARSSGAMDESAFDLVVTNLNLADWAAFAGPGVKLSSGTLGVSLGLVSKQAGKDLSFQLATRIAGLTAAAGSNRIDNADLALDAAGAVRDFDSVNLGSFRAELARAGRSAVTAGGSLQYSARSQNADIRADLVVQPREVAGLVTVPGLNVEGGNLSFNGRILQTNATPQATNNPVLDRSITGRLALADFTGTFQSNRFDRLAAGFNLDVAMHDKQVTIRQCAGELKQSGEAAGAVDVTGQFNTATQTGDVKARLAGVNQHLLKSFATAALGDKQLESVLIDLTAEAQLNGSTELAAKTTFHLTNLVVIDPSGAIPKTPLAVDMTADLARRQGVFDLRSARLALTGTDRAANVLNATGRVDLTSMKAIRGHLQIASDGLDLTRYYDLFADRPAAKKDGKKSKAESPGGNVGADPVGTPPSDDERKTPPRRVRIEQFTQNLDIAKLFLREIAISNLTQKTVIVENRVALDPCRLSLNGAPVSLDAKVDLTVPGYGYDVTAKIDRVPVEPVVNTFKPDMRGQVKGDLLAEMRVAGTGTSGEALQKTLHGSIALTLTNADVQIIDNKLIQAILKPVATLLTVPDLATSPLRWIDTHIGITNGTATITNLSVRSSVLAAEADRTISIAPVLTNSTFNDIPVRIGVVRSIADRIKYFPGTTSGDIAMLPHFYTLSGTIGQPDPHLDKTAITKALFGAAVQNLGGDAGKFLRNITGQGGEKKPADKPERTVEPVPVPSPAPAPRIAPPPATPETPAIPTTPAAPARPNNNVRRPQKEAVKPLQEQTAPKTNAPAGRPGQKKKPAGGN